MLQWFSLSSPSCMCQTLQMLWSKNTSKGYNKTAKTSAGAMRFCINSRFRQSQSDKFKTKFDIHQSTECNGAVITFVPSIWNFCSRGTATKLLLLSRFCLLGSRQIPPIIKCLTRSKCSYFDLELGDSYILTGQ